MNDYVSQVQIIRAPQEAVYNKISDLNNLQALKQRLSDPDTRRQASDRFGENKTEAAAQYLNDLVITKDTVEIGGTPIGTMKLQVVEREQPKLMKLEGVGTPVPLNLWVQIIPHGEGESALRVTLRAELNFFFRQMVGKHLQHAADALAQILSRIEY